MTDCTRFSDAEIVGKEAYYISGERSWVPQLEHQGKGADTCRDTCVSEPACKVWRYNHASGECAISASEVEDITATSTGYSSGRLRCAAEYDMLKIFIYAMAIAFIFVAWWFLTRPCKR